MIKISFKNAPDIGWMGWPIAYLAHLAGLGRTHQVAYDATRTGQAVQRGERPPAFPLKGATEATLLSEKEVPILISADRQWIQNVKSKAVAYLADVAPARIRQAVAAQPSAKPTPTRTDVPPEYRQEPFRSAFLKLVETARELAPGARLADADQEALGRRLSARPDFLWHLLLQSFATMGRSDAARVFMEEPVYSTVAYDRLEALSPARRRAQITQAVEAGGLRFPAKKVDYLLGCLDHIQSLGGLTAAQESLRRLPTATAKIDFLKSFPGIGDKYARNLLMDMADPILENAIAIDSRIQSISDAAGLRFSDYAAHEAFYLAVARAAGLTGRQLDRLLYQNPNLFREKFAS